MATEPSGFSSMSGVIRKRPSSPSSGLWTPGSKHSSSPSISPVYNNREIDVRNGLVFPPKVNMKTAIDSIRHPRWLFGTAGRYYLAEKKLPAFTNIYIPEEAKAEATGYVSAKSTSFLNRDDTMDYDYLRRIRDLWPHKLLVKGVLHPEDAVMIADAGADGIFVSNHAGNTNDTAITPWDALPAIVDAVGDTMTVIADSRRRGSDVLKASPWGRCRRHRSCNTLWGRRGWRGRRNTCARNSGSRNSAHHGRDRRQRYTVDYP